jgi:phage shock protein PspC (stress-responsive transcriptional regulator)
MVHPPGPRHDPGMTSTALHGTPTTLTRSSSDKRLFGVAGGLGAYFSVDPVLFRIGFVVATLMGGVGAVAYVAAAILVPTEDRIPAPAVA